MEPISEAFARTCRDNRHRTALWSRAEGVRLTFAELAERVEARARQLAGADGLPPGRPAAVATGNGAAFPELFFALAARGVPMVAMDGGLPAVEKACLCRRLGVPTLLTAQGIPDPSGPTAASPALQGKKAPAPPERASSAREWGGGLIRTDFSLDAPAEPPAGTALIKLTSGSTGKPAGICLTGEALAAGISQIAEGMEITAEDRLLIAIPLSHSYGFDHGVLGLGLVGTPLILEPGYYPGSLLRALAEGEATFFPAVPPMIRALAETEWPEGLPLRTVISAGGPLDPKFARRFRRRSGLPVRQFYGSTETGGITYERRPDEPGALGTVGEPLPGVRVEIAEDGTVTVTSAATFHSYLGDSCPGEARETEGTDVTELGRRVVLGDRGEWTPEGRLRLTGRTADLLNVGGRRVSANAIETALRQLPGIDDAAVVGVEDPVRGDRVVAFVVGELPSRSGGACRLPAGLAPRDLRSIDALPFTRRGKLDRAELRRRAARRPGPEEGTP